MHTSQSLPKGEGMSHVKSYTRAVRDITTAVQLLQECGLSFNIHEVSVEVIEQVLMTDPWVCTACASPSEPLCPHTGKPHRRRLVLVAEEILQCVGQSVGRICKRPAPLRERLEGDAKMYTHRRVSMKPHLLLLAFHIARLNAGEVSEMLVQCAQHLLDMLEQLQAYGKRLEPQMSDRYSKGLLKSFSNAWLQYVKLTEKETQELDPLEQRVSTNMLLHATKAAFLAAARERARVLPNEKGHFTAFMDLLYQRMRYIASEEQLLEVQSELTQIEEVTSSPILDSTSGRQSLAAHTPPAQCLNHPLLLETNTTGSDTDTGNPMLPAPRTGGRVMGPELPPHWYVDEAGRSRPRPDYQERQKKESFLRSEFKARKAFEAVLNYKPMKSTEEQLREKVSLVINEAELAELTHQLNQPTPVVNMIPQFLRLIQESLLQAVPVRLQYYLEQQFCDALDWNWVLGRATKSHQAMSRIVQFVVNHVAALGASAREEALREESKRVCEDLDQLRPDLGTAIAEAFRFLLRSIRTLRQDVAEYGLKILAGELRGNAVTYIRAFVEEYLPDPRQWHSSILFLQKFINAEAVKNWAGCQEVRSSMSLASEERRLYAALHFGAVDLLRSGGSTSADRWESFPGEIFYFEKAVVFSCANTVQESTLLLLLEGTASVMLSSRGFSHQQVSDTLRSLHNFFLGLLAQDLRLSALKQSVIDFLDAQLSSKAFGDRSGCEPRASNILSEIERNSLSSTIDKMTDTKSSLYILFERKVLNYAEAFLSSTSSDSLAPLGLVTNTLQDQMRLLKSALVFHWEVYRPYYKALKALLTFEF